MEDSNRDGAAEASEAKSAPRGRRNVISEGSMTNVSQVTKDERLGPYASDVTHWRCRRVDDSSNGNSKGTPLFWGDEDGVQMSEWPIGTLSLDVLRERWGAGRYVIHYVRIDGAGARVPRGRSRVVQLVGTQESEPVVVVPPPRTNAHAANPLAGLVGSDPSYVFSLLTFLEERNERARAAAAAEAKLHAERYRADMELFLERERLSTQERIATMQAQMQATPAGAANSLLLERLARVEGRLETIDSGDDDGDAGSAGGGGIQDLGTLIQTLGPLITQLGPFLKQFLPDPPPGAGMPNAPPGEG